MTPAINSAKRAQIGFRVHEYTHDPGAASYGLEAAEKLGADPGRVFKTLVAALDDGELVVAIVPVATSLNVAGRPARSRDRARAGGSAPAVSRSARLDCEGVSCAVLRWQASHR